MRKIPNNQRNNIYVLLPITDDLEGYEGRIHILDKVTDKEISNLGYIYIVDQHNME